MADTARGPAEVVELSRTRQAAVRRVAEVRATVPHFSVGAEADAPDHLSGLVGAVGHALREHPAVNGAYRDGRLERYPRVNVAVALPGPDGPVAPVVFDADARDEDEIATELAELAERAAAGELTAPELAGATFTVVHVACSRIDPVLAGGQAATLGAGAFDERPFAKAEIVGVRPRVDLTLACDARALTPDEAAAFLVTLRASLEATV